MRRTLFAILSAALVSGCSGGGSSTPVSVSQAPNQPQSMSRQFQSTSVERQAASGPAEPFNIITVGAGANEYTQFGGFITAIPGVTHGDGLALDASGNLYVANTYYNFPSVLVYSRSSNYQSVIETLTDPYGALNVAVDQNTGTVAVINNVVYNPVGNVTIYAPGSTTPCANLSFPNMLELFQGAFNSAGDLYVTGQVFEGNPAIGVIQGGCAATTLTLLKTREPVGSFGGIAFAPNGNLAVEEGVNILTYRPPVNGELGKPISATYIQGTVGSQQFAFTQHGAFVFVVDNYLNKVFKYHYPAGNAPIYSFSTKELHPGGLVLAPIAQ